MADDSIGQNSGARWIDSALSGMMAVPMGALEIPEYVHAYGTFAGEAAPPAGFPSDGIAAQSGISGFTRNGPGDYTVTLTSPISFLEAAAAAEVGLNQLVVIGAQIDPDTQRVQVRSYDTLGVPADCRVFNVKVAKLQTGPPGQIAIPGPVVPVVVGGGDCGPTTFLDVNQDDSIVALAYETQYQLNNDGVGNPAANTETQLPLIALADKGRCIWVYTCYSNDPNDPQLFGHGQVKVADPAPDQIKLDGGNIATVDLFVQDDSLKFYHDGVDTWYLGN